MFNLACVIEEPEEDVVNPVVVDPVEDPVIDEVPIVIEEPIVEEEIITLRPIVEANQTQSITDHDKDGLGMWVIIGVVVVVLCIGGFIIYQVYKRNSTRKEIESQQPKKEVTKSKKNKTKSKHLDVTQVPSKKKKKAIKPLDSERLPMETMATE